MLDDADGETWHSRRSAAVRRPKDEQDFSAALPLLSELQRAWLRDAIRTAYGDENAWLERFN
ncbi:hypothetical protein PMI07_003098 [Rhizobium sp. CF080]|uniref:hypothetical protein n=1 Tax=Rhizobium sp. (strain CF080) TaxID=1144310 RepID=UPI000271896E|nr:hypothetical protein [Rhizobium sp. CF080]EUB95320.1 hypothetical protein PMI07_003098 [Rhizobium sp. CF080]